MTNISDKDAMLKKFGELADAKVCLSLAERKLAWEFYQYAYFSCLSEFEQVGEYTARCLTQKCNKAFFGVLLNEAPRLGTPLFTRKG